MGIITELQSRERIRLATPAEEEIPPEDEGKLVLNPQALKTLIHPQYLGHSFQALLQTRGL